MYVYACCFIERCDIISLHCAKNQFSEVSSLVFHYAYILVYITRYTFNDLNISVCYFVIKVLSVCACVHVCICARVYLYLHMYICCRRTGQTEVRRKVPDSITSWVVTAFSLNNAHGLGLIEEPRKVFILSISIIIHSFYHKLSRMTLKRFNPILYRQQICYLLFVF